MSTKKLYWELPYEKNFQAQVHSITGNFLVLDQSIFYPTGGGVSCDSGTINGVEVIESKKGENDSIVHVLAEIPNFKTGDVVRGNLNWDRRYKLMKLHTSAHLLSAVIYKKTGSLITGGNIEPDKARLDFNLDLFSREIAQSYVDEANKLIANGSPIKTYFLKREEALKTPGMVKLAEAFPPDVDNLRIVEIDGIDTQADGGLHVKNISEIGQIEIVKTENKGKNNRRLYYRVNP